MLKLLAALSSTFKRSI